MQNTKAPPAELGVDNLRFVPANLRRLVVAGAMSTDAQFLALQLIAKMQETGRLQVTHTLQEAQRTMVCHGTNVIGGRVGSDLLAMVGALQQVHCLAGFYNHYAEVGLEGADPQVHFTNDPTVSFGEHWSERTPIVFRFDWAHMNYWTQISKDAVPLSGVTFLPVAF